LGKNPTGKISTEKLAEDILFIERNIDMVEIGWKNGDWFYHKVDLITQVISIFETL